MNYSSFLESNSVYTGLFLQWLEYHKPNAIMVADGSRVSLLANQVVRFITYYSSTACLPLGHVSI